MLFQTTPLHIGPCQRLLCGRHILLGCVTRNGKGGTLSEKNKFVPRLIEEEEVIWCHIHEFIWKVGCRSDTRVPCPGSTN